MISIDRGNGIETVDEAILEGPFYQITDNANEYTVATEYRLDGKVVHRSAHITLKDAVISSSAGAFGG